MFKRFFIDLDGVLADFDTHFEKKFKIHPTKLERSEIHKRLAMDSTFFNELPMLPGAKQFWNWLILKGFNPTILTGVPHTHSIPAEYAKKAWVARHLGYRVKTITCRSEDKYLHGKPGDVLVDDRIKYAPLWAKMGGVFIHHTDYEVTKSLLLMERRCDAD